MPEKPLKITAISVRDLSEILSKSCGKKITAEQVRAIADKAGIVKGSSISIIEYTAFLAKEVAGGAD